MIHFASQVVQVVKNPPANAGDIRDGDSVPGSGRSPGGGRGTHCSVLAGRIPQTEEPGGLQSTGLHRVMMTDRTWQRIISFRVGSAWDSWPRISRLLCALDPDSGLFLPLLLLSEPGGPPADSVSLPIFSVKASFCSGPKGSGSRGE